MNIEALQRILINVLIENQRYVDISMCQIQDFAEIVSDRALLYRFLRKHKQSIEDAEITILSHLDWRVNQNITELNMRTIDDGALHYISQGLFRFGPVDSLGRPVAFLTPCVFKPNSTKEVEDLKTAILLLLEVLRRWIMMIDKPHVNQVLIVVDLKGFGMSNMVNEFDIGF
jgi:hypothetical protein